MSTDLPLTPEDVDEIVAILDGSPYERLEIRTARFNLKLAKAGGQAEAGWTQEWSAATAVSAAAPAETEAAEAEEDADGFSAVRPPLPGTFYRAPQPGAPPFVEPGDRVGPETVVGIVETMKLMNPVHAGVSGEVVDILVENGTLIDGDAILMRVKPDAQ